MTVDFLIAEHARFAGMRIEAEHGDARRGDAEVRAQGARAGCAGVRSSGSARDRVGDRAQAAGGWSPARPAAIGLASIITTSRPACPASSSVVPV